MEDTDQQSNTEWISQRESRAVYLYFVDIGKSHTRTALKFSGLVLIPYAKTIWYYLDTPIGVSSESKPRSPTTTRKPSIQANLAAATRSVGNPSVGENGLS